MRLVQDLKIVGKDGAVSLKVLVQTRSAENRIAGCHAGALKIRVNAPPVDNRANSQLLNFLAQLLGLSRQDVSLASGHCSRSKRVHLKGLSAMELMKHLTQHLTNL